MVEIAIVPRAETTLMALTIVGVESTTINSDVANSGRDKIFVCLPQGLGHRA